VQVRLSAEVDLVTGWDVIPVSSCRRCPGGIRRAARVPP